MKKIYSNIIQFVEKLPLMLHLLKTAIAENVAIINKRKLYKNVIWTKEQQNDFDNFWKKYYGRKISNRWHRLYQSINGVYDVKYFPEILFTTKFEPLLNPYNIGKVLQDKSFVELLFGGTNDVIFPKTYIICCSGIFYDSNRIVITEELAINSLVNIGDAVIKITIGSSSGKGVEMVSFGNNSIRTKEQIQKLFQRFGRNFIIQERIKQHKLISQIYDKSINTFRVMTYILDGKVCHFPVSIRIGGNGSVVDNIHAGGMAVGVSDEGTLAKYAYRLGYGDSNERYEKHPNTGIAFEGIKIPFIPKIIDNSYQLHGRVPHIGTISWDFAVNNADKTVLLEVNLLNQGSWLPQIIGGKGLFGDNTEKVLNKIAKLR